MSLLEVRDLHVTYHGSRGAVPAVRGMSFALESGQTIGIAGESGSGKSTLTLAILRLLPQRAEITGEIRLNGEDVLTMDWGRLRAVRWVGAAIIFQGAMHALNPVYRVGQQIAEPILLHQKVSRREAHQRAEELLVQVGMPSWRTDNYPHELSGGQRQRVMIAMALACSPDLIIADEATTALDVMVQAQVLAVISTLVKKLNVGLIMISHDLSVLAENCERVGVMYAGKLVEIGSAHDVFAQPMHPYSDALGSAFPAIGDFASRRNPQGLAGDPPDPTDLPDGCSFHPRCVSAVAECSTTSPELLPVGGGASAVRQEAACLVTQAGGPVRPAQPEENVQ